MRLRILLLCGVRPALRLNEGAGDVAARIVFSLYGPEVGLRLIDTLLEVGADGERKAPNDDGDALARAVVATAVRDPIPLPDCDTTQAANGRHGNNGHNGHMNGDRLGVEPPARVPSAS